MNKVQNDKEQYKNLKQTPLVSNMYVLRSIKKIIEKFT
jgi:hypothetical protein